MTQDEDDEARQAAAQGACALMTAWFGPECSGADYDLLEELIQRYQRDGQCREVTYGFIYLSGILLRRIEKLTDESPLTLLQQHALGELEP